MGPSDWEANPYIQNLSQSSLDVLPCSCFNSAQTVLNSSWCLGATNTTLLHTQVLQHTLPHTLTVFEAAGFSYASLFSSLLPLFQGCETLLHEWLHQNILTIISMDFGLILIQVKQRNHIVES